MLQGLRRLNQHVPKRARPITPQIVRQIHAGTDHTNTEEVVFWAACVMAFFLLFHKSNLLPDTQGGFNFKKQLCHADCIVSGGRVVVGIRWAKNAQFSRELLTFPLPRLTSSVLCPEKVILAVRSMVKHGLDDHLFKIDNHCSLTYRKFQSMLHNKLKLARIPYQNQYSSHSFHRGGNYLLFSLWDTFRIDKTLGELEI